MKGQRSRAVKAGSCPFKSSPKAQRIKRAVHRAPNARFAGSLRQRSQRKSNKPITSINTKASVVQASSHAVSSENSGTGNTSAPHFLVKESPKSGQQFLGVEGLGQVITGTGLKSTGDLRARIDGAEHQHRP